MKKIIFVVILVLVLVPLALVAWNSVAAQVPKAEVSPIDSDNVRIWAKQCASGNAKPVLQPAYDRVRIFCYRAEGGIDWQKDGLLFTQNQRLVYERYIPDLPGYRVVYLEPLE